MQRNHETSLGCLKIKLSHGNSHENKNSAEGFPELKDEMNVHPGGIMDSDNSSNRESCVPVGQGCGRPMYQQEVFTWPNFYPDARGPHQNQFNSFENHTYPMTQEYILPIENETRYLPFKMFSEGYPHEVQYQEFQYFVVIDFEATCDKEHKPHPQEIIEFPSVLVNGLTGQLEASFQTYVRPAYHQLLTDYCKELTGIQQIQVDRGISLSEALIMHDRWLEDKGIKQKNFAVVTWGDWDCRVMLDSECRFKNIGKPPYFNRWINLKVLFHKVFGGVRRNLKEAVELAGLVFEGRPHSGLDDARNTARLLAFLMGRGFHFSITSSLVSPSIPWTYPYHTMDFTHQSQNSREMVGTTPQFQPSAGEENIYCFCRAKSRRCMVRKPGPTHGRLFFGCGNWTAARGAVCDYFAWASP